METLASARSWNCTDWSPSNGSSCGLSVFLPLLGQFGLVFTKSVYSRRLLFSEQGNCWYIILQLMHLFPFGLFDQFFFFFLLTHSFAGKGSFAIVAGDSWGPKLLIEKYRTEQLQLLVLSSRIGQVSESSLCPSLLAGNPWNQEERLLQATISSWNGKPVKPGITGDRALWSRRYHMIELSEWYCHKKTETARNKGQSRSNVKR